MNLDWLKLLLVWNFSLAKASHSQEKDRQGRYRMKIGSVIPTIVTDLTTFNFSIISNVCLSVFVIPVHLCPDLFFTLYAGHVSSRYTFVRLII